MPSPDKISVIVVDDTDESREMILRMLQFDARHRSGWQSQDGPRSH